MLTMLSLQTKDDTLIIQLQKSNPSGASSQEKIVKEKQKYSDLLGKYEEPQSLLSLDSEVQTELKNLQLTMEKICISLGKVEVIKKYLGDKVADNIMLYTINLFIQLLYT